MPFDSLSQLDRKHQIFFVEVPTRGKRRVVDVGIGISWIGERLINPELKLAAELIVGSERIDRVGIIVILQKQCVGLRRARATQRLVPIDRRRFRRGPRTGLRGLIGGNAVAGGQAQCHECRRRNSQNHRLANDHLSALPKADSEIR